MAKADRPSLCGVHCNPEWRLHNIVSEGWSVDVGARLAGSVCGVGKLGARYSLSSEKSREVDRIEPELKSMRVLLNLCFCRKNPLTCSALGDSRG
jgi:hypothetical protein